MPAKDAEGIMEKEAVRTILVVDDEVETLDFVGNILRRASYRVLLAQTGSQALGLAKLKQPDVIILDVILPDIRGEELKRSLAEEPRTSAIPVIFLTGILTKEEEQIFKRMAKGVRTLAKPVAAEELLAVLKESIV